MKIAFLLIFLFSGCLFGSDENHDFSGELTLENRFYPEKGIYGNSERSDTSLVLKPEYSYSWDDDRKVISLIPYVRLSQLDDNKTHADLREMSFVGSWKKIEARVGISKVFWGVTESQHLVDVINQTDQVENFDGEDKLGQPMINVEYISDLGNFSFFLLPFFRERTFSGESGRLRGPFVIDTKRATYSNKNKDKQIDYAFRWSHYIGSLEWGISYFKGVDRSPFFNLDTNSNKLIPFYGDSEQGSLDLQYVLEDWLFKAEVLKKDSEYNGNYLASVLGFEYTFSNVLGGADIGFLYEWIYDERGDKSGSGLSDSSFVGGRVALNDEKSTDFLLGGIIDHREGRFNNLRLESSRRINENWKWELEGSIFSSNRGQTFIGQLKKDDYVQFSLSFYW